MQPAIETVLNTLFDGQGPVTEDMAEAAFSVVMDGKCSEIEIAAFLTALRATGETTAQITGAARVMRQRATRIPCRSRGLLDTCGTGGDCLHTFNISTATAFVAAGAGVTVAKHGNRSVTSSSGSADVLEALGINVQLTAEQVGHCVDEVGIGFCFAPLLHSAMKHVGPVRKQLGFRTIFNLLGPLTNPAGAEYQLLGANRAHFAKMLATSLQRLGCVRAIVVTGNDELDEVSLWGRTSYHIVTSGNMECGEWEPKDFGLPECSVDELKVTSAQASADRISQVLAGVKGPSRDIVVINAAAALLAAGKSTQPRDAAEMAASAIDSGRASKVLERLKSTTQSFAAK